MTVCFMILAHSRPQQFRDLTRMIKNAGGGCVAFIDKKAHQADFYSDDVHFVAERFNVNWGGYSQARAMQALLRESVRAYPNAHHYIFLSGQDYPARSLREYMSYLGQAENRERCWMNFYAMAPDTQFYTVLKYPRSYDLKARLGDKAYAVVQKLWDAYYTRRPRMEYPVQFYRGSSSWVVSRTGALAMLEFLDSDRGKEVQKFLKKTHIFDEIWGATALLNSSAKEQAVAWDTDGQLEPGVMKGENKVYHHYIDWDPERENPALLHLGDLEKIDASGKWFVRKVDPEKSKDLLDVLRSRQNDSPLSSDIA